MKKLDLTASRDFVLEQARANIARVVDDPGYVERAKQVNASFASIVAMERNAVMFEALKIQDEKVRRLPIS